jgi:pimeloyl-ACP methyl ester carboxylesterase
MSDALAEDPGKFLSQIRALEAHDNLFKDLYVDHDDDLDSVAGLRRRRRRASNTPDDKILTVSLIEENGVLRWCDGVPAPDQPPPRRRHRRAARAAEPPPLPDQKLILTKEFPRLLPNRAAAAIGAIDRQLNPEIGEALRSRLREVKQTQGNFVFAGDVNGPFKEGRTLLFVHGTFSNAANMLAEFCATPEGRAFLNDAAAGDHKYDRILFFEHPTLAVSPVLNALELGRALADSSGPIDVIAHSRGGLIVRWWLEAFGSALSSTARVRVVFAGSPLHGTSLAAPDKLQHALSLISNVGTFAEKTMQLIGVANPFLWVAGKLVEVVMTVTGTLANTPLIDGLVALIPGLFGQSRISNNYELNLLRLGPCNTRPDYFVVQSNFETPDPGWQFWKNFRLMRAGDIAADAVFEGPNDLVVDTISMTDLGEVGFPLNVVARQDFGTSPDVWHCNYFRQKETIAFIRTSFP